LTVIAALDGLKKQMRLVSSEFRQPVVPCARFKLGEPSQALMVVAHHATLSATAFLSETPRSALICSDLATL
jgi:hypothetical protein